MYCEKPLTHTVFEARTISELAAKSKLATQMGTQIHASDNYRRVVEIVQSGAIGPVREVHTWAGRAWGGGDRPKEQPPVPPNIHWDLWLGPAPKRPYHPTYLPANWRKWWDFGGGNIGDMACHYMDLPFWALELKNPTTIEAEGPPVHPETCPLGLIVRYHYAAQGERPPVKLTWYDGTKIPPSIHGHPTGGGGNLFVGEKGMLRADYGSYQLYPEKDFAGLQAPERVDPPFDRPSQGMDSGVQNRLANDLQFQICRRVDGSRATRQCRLPHREATRMGRRETQSHKLPRG